MLKGVRLSHTAQQKRGRTYEAQATSDHNPFVLAEAWKSHLLYPFHSCYLLSHLPQNSEKSAERSLHHHCTLWNPQKLQQQLGLKPLTAPQVTSCLPTGLITYYPTLSQPLSQGGPSQQSRRLQKEAQQETPTAASSFKWFNVYLVPEIGH